MTIEGCVDGGVVMFPCPLLAQCGNLCEVLQCAWKNVVRIPEKVVARNENAITDWSVRFVVNDFGLAEVQEISSSFLELDEILAVVSNIVEKVDMIVVKEKMGEHIVCP